VYSRPKNMFVAGILGNPSMNFLSCEIHRENGSLRIKHSAFSAVAERTNEDEFLRGMTASGKALVFGVRPEDISIFLNKPKGASIEAEIYVTEPLGNKTIVDIKLGNEVIKAVVRASFTAAPEQKVWITMKGSKLHLFDPETKECVAHSDERAPMIIS
jgi:multiple sugar transport system ATP-binding protein